MLFPAPRILESDVFPKFHLRGFLVCWWVVLIVLKNWSIFSKVVKSSVVAGQDCGAMKVSTNYPLLTLCTCSHLSPSWSVDNQRWWDIDSYMWDLQITHNGREHFGLKFTHGACSLKNVTWWVNFRLLRWVGWCGRSGACEGCWCL